MKTPAFWYQAPGITANILTPLGCLWRAGGALRQALATPYRSQKPVICIGNIVTGGAGKTPTALAIAQLLQQAGYTPVFVARGYGGSERGPLRVDLLEHNAHNVGDEALLLARTAPTFIGRDRVAAIKEAEQHGSHIILDDGLQNPHVHPDLSLLVIDGETGLGNGHLIPAGPLRELLKNALRRVTAVVLIGAIDIQNLAERIECSIFRAVLQPALPNGFPRTEKFFAFAGIGRPEKFYATCRAAGLKLVGTKDFPDHHVFTTVDIARLREQAKQHDAKSLTTEKDWVRLPDDFRDEVAALPVTLTFAEPSAIKSLLIGYKG